MESALSRPNATGTAEALAILAKCRDQAAWEVVVRAHGNCVLNVARRITRDGELAEDACQETFLQLRDSAAQFDPRCADPEKAARAWILRIAVNRSFSLL